MSTHAHPGDRCRRALVGALAAFVISGIAAAEDPLTFERHVRPLFKAHCFHCHGEDSKREGGLDLRLRRLILAGGESGAGLVPGRPDESYLLERIVAGEMPPGEDAPRLAAGEIDVVRRWIASGASTARPEPDEITAAALLTAEELSHWSFQPVLRPALPATQHADRLRNPVDAFILQRLEDRRWTFAPDADRRTLIRRLAFGLLGLPPDAVDVDGFVADRAPDAAARLIDRLLASPHYGERWGRHWLDVAGYADSEGYSQSDPVRSDAWKYRDYVVAAWNADKPFDAFVLEQLAGDELVEPPYVEMSPDEIEKLIATGFLRMAPDGTATGGVDLGLAGNQSVADTLRIVSTSMLGLTVGCAQCHNHRYDPIPQSDYYALRSIFEPAFDTAKWRKPATRRVSLYTDADRAESARIEADAQKIDAERTKKQNEFIQRTFDAEVAKLPEDLRDAARLARQTVAKDRTPEQQALLREHPSLNVSAGSLYLYDRRAADELKAMAARARAVRDTKPKEEFVRALTEVPGRAPVARLFYRGDYEQPKQELDPAALTAVSLNVSADQIPREDQRLDTSGRRLAWARWLTSGRHPLTARVLVNRVWLHHFGRGIVNSPGDFGTLGEKPSHPALLDWLADWFVTEGDWSLKRLHRVLLTSTTYQQALRRDAEQAAADPDNRLFGGSRLKRLEAEIVRDSILSVSGLLNDKRGGPPVPVMADRVGKWVIGQENLNAGRPGAVIPLHGEEYRRSVYVQARRSRPLAVLQPFDLPTTAPNCDKRPSSTVTTQSLLLMNSEFALQQARRLAERIQATAGSDPGAEVRSAWRVTLGRPPSPDELQDSIAFLKRQAMHFPAASGEDQPSAERQALASLCQMLFSSNEFLYVD